MFMVLALVAGVVRGYSGFGFAMILALGLLPSLAPTLVIPVVLMLDLAGSVSLWPRALKAFHRQVGVRLIVGMWLALPLIVYLLRSGLPVLHVRVWGAMEPKNNVSLPPPLSAPSQASGSIKQLHISVSVNGEQRNRKCT